MDRFTNTNGDRDGSNGTTASFHNTRTICAPLINTSKTQKGDISATKRNKKGETKDE